MRERGGVGAGGRFLVLEGCEGSGKSTQAALLVEALRADGHAVVSTREPGGSPAAEAMRDLLLACENAGLDPKAEALLFAAARADHVAAAIRPALARGAVVVCDRFVDSSLAYQGAGRGLGVEAVRRLNDFATNGLRPDLTVVLDVDPAEGLARAGRAGPVDRIESETAEFHGRVRKAFLDLAAADPERYCVIGPGGDVDAVATEIVARTRTLLHPVPGHG